MANTINGNSIAHCPEWLKVLNESVLFKGFNTSLAATWRSIVVNALTVVKSKKVPEQQSLKSKTYWRLVEWQQEHSEVCEICNTTFFQHPDSAKLFCTGRLLIKWKQRKSPLQQYNKVHANRHLPPTIAVWRVIRQGAKAVIGATLFNRTLKRGPACTD